MTANKKNDRETLFDRDSNKREERTFVSEQSKASDILDEDEQNMLSIGEFSPNNPKMRVATQPYLGLGEYDDHRRQLLNDQRRAEYQEYTEKVKRADEQHNAFIKSNFRESRPVANGRSNSVDKAIQTDIKNVNSKLVHYEVTDLTEMEKQRSGKGRGVMIDKVQIETQNNIVEPATGYSQYMDKIGAVTSTSPRAKLMADLQSSCFPSVMGYKAANTVDDERFEKVRRQEKYLAELRQQVEEKQMLQKKHKEDEKHEDDLENARVVTQMRNLNFNKREGHGYGRQCYSSNLSTDYYAPINSQGYDNKSDHTYDRNKRMNEKRLNSRVTHYSDTSKYTNSPPLSKRDNKPPFSFNISPNSVFANSVPVKKRNSKLIINVNNKELTTKMKNNQSRLNYTNTNTNKLEESLPIPVLKAQSPVAKELINAMPVHSRTSDAMRKLEDKWQIPAMQKNIIKTFERPVEGNNQGVLTQLGAIRLQLQQEQLRLDETLRKRGTSQSQQTIYADIHRNLN